MGKEYKTFAAENTEELEKELNRLAREGFILRRIFYISERHYPWKVILERDTFKNPSRR